MSAANKNARFGIGDILLLVIGVVFVIGMFTAFGPCGPKDDGTWMSCHWAGQAVKGISVVLLVMAVIHAVLPNAQAKMGVAISEIPVAVLAAVIPGTVIDMCMMQDMTCWAVMRPAVIVMALLTIVAAVIDVLMQRKRVRVAEHGELPKMSL